MAESDLERLYITVWFYGKNKDERLEVILAFEEKLLTGTVGKIIGDQSGKVDVMMLNVT